MTFIRSAMAAIVMAAALSTSAQAVTIDFEDLTTRNNFGDLGIQSTYHGFVWGSGLAGGVSARNFSVQPTGWASATTFAPAVAPTSPMASGSSYAWNWAGPQSLWINFGTSTDFTSGDFSTLSSAYSSNASNITLYGYDGSSNLLDTSSTLNLTNSMQTLSAAFSGIQYLEIRSNSSSAWFSVDNLVINENTAVPEPASIAAMLTGIAGLLRLRRRRAV